MANHSSGRRLDTGKGASSSRSSSRDASSSGQMTSSASNTRKSERLEKKTPLTPPTARRKSVRLEKQSTPSPLRRSDRGKTNSSPTSSGSRSLEKVSTLLGRLKMKEKKEKSVKQLTMESVEVIVGGSHDDDEPLFSLKRKRLDGRTFKALFKKQKRRYLAPDSHDKLERQDTLHQIDTVDSGANGSKPLDDRENRVHESGHSLAEDLGEEPLGRATEDENHGFSGNCASCSKRRRLDYDSPEERLCSCGEVLNWTCGDTSILKVTGNVEAASNLESVGGHKCTTQFKEMPSGTETDSLKHVCILCKNGGKLLCCAGQSCRRYYHISCLDPSLDDDLPLPGVWHCLCCVKKKIKYGVHAVSKGIESIWDVREVVEEDMEGIHRQKQYLVKYQGLAHVFNQWVPERQLIHEDPSMVAKFNREHENLRWNPEWRLPHRLLRKRRLISCSQQDEYQNLNVDVIPNCQFEWFVKWCGLDYDHATWEIESMDILCSPQGRRLVTVYENRRQKAKKVSDKGSEGAPVKLSKLPGGGSPMTDDNLVNNVNKLRQFWYKNKNAVIFDEQGRLVNVILFILSLSEYHQPFLIVTTPNALSQWEVEFRRLAPSVDVVVYSGNADTRRTIRTLEFYDEGGGIIFQLLLATLEIVIEDLQSLRGIKWEAVIVDECQCSNVNANVELIKMLPMNMRLLLFSGQLKDVAEYQALLSLLDSSGDLDRVGGLRTKPNDDLVELKESISQFIAYGSKFVEYWVPSPISNLQLELYCATLLEKTMVLCSASEKDSVGAFQDALEIVQKCCSHPYLVDPSPFQTAIFKELQAVEVLNVGIKASGKLQLLDMILSKIRRRRLKVLVLFQPIVGPGKISTGDILDDLLCQRFGKNSYERINSLLAPQKKQAAMDRFNCKEGEPFVFLLESRACLPSIKLSVDFVVIFDSEWNPANDIKALQKISIVSHSEEVKVFRLYSSCTLEEKLLILSKHHTNLHKQNTRRATGDTLLMWGASSLFSRLDKYHAKNSTVSAADISSGQEGLLDDVVKDLMAKLLDDSENKHGHESLISKVSRNTGVYHTDCLLLGERELQYPDEDRQIFWKKLLEERNPRWKLLAGPTPRIRKRVQYAENDEVENKRHKVVNTCNTELYSQHELEERGQAAGSKAVFNQSQSPPMLVACTLDNANKAANLLSEEASCSHEGNMSHPKGTPSGEQMSLHTSLRAEMAKLCETLKLSKDVKGVVGKFLEYVMENHHVNKEPASILQAFQMSVCWIAASVLKVKIDRRDCLTLAKQAFDYQCTEEEANSVYRKLRSLKRAFLQLPGNNSGSIPSRNTSAFTEPSAYAGEPPSASFNLQNVKVEVEERTSSLEPSKENATVVLSANLIDRKIKKIQKKCDEHMLQLHVKQEQEIQEFNKRREVMRLKLEADHELGLTMIHRVYSQSAMRMDQLKKSESDFHKMIQEHENLMEMQLKQLEARHASAREEETKKIAGWVAKINSCISQCRDVGELRIHGSESNFEVESCVGSEHIASQGLENEIPPISAPDLGEQSPDTFEHVTGASETIMSDTSVTAGRDASGCAIHSKTLPVSVNPVSDNKVLGILPEEASSVARVEEPKELSQTSTITPDINAEDAVGSIVPVERSSVYSISDKDIVRVETASVARIEQPKEACPSSHMDTPNCSQGTEKIASVGLATSEEQNTVKTGEGRGNSLGSDVMRNLKGGTDCLMCETVPSSQLQSVERIPVATIPSELPKRVLQDECLANSESADMQDEDVYIIGNQITSVGCASCTPADVGGNLKSNFEAQVIENTELLQPASNCSAPICSLPTVAKVVLKGHIEGGNSLQSSEASQQLDEMSVQLCDPASSQMGGNLVQLASSTYSSSVCCQPPVAGIVHQGHLEAINSLQSFPQSVEGSLEFPHEAAIQNSGNSVQPASDCSSPVYSHHTAAEPVDQGHNEGNNSLQTPEASPKLVDRSVELSQAASQDGENLVQPTYSSSSPICSQPIVAEHVRQSDIEESNSPQASNQMVEGSVELSHQAVPDNGRNLVLTPSTEAIDSGCYQNHFDLQTERTDHEPNRLSALCQNSVASTQAVENATELPAQEVEELGLNLAIPHGPTHQQTLQSHCTASLSPTLPLYAEPLQNELERIRKETEQTIVLHDSTKLQLQSECEKEIEETIAQIRGKYKAKLKDAESAFLLKKSELDSNHKKVLMNKILAEAFQAKCLNLKPSRSSMQQGGPFPADASSSLLQHMSQLAFQTTLRHASAATLSPASQPTVSQHIAIQPVQSLHRSPGFFPSVPARPPQISAISPSTGGLRVGGEIRAPAPHLQPFRPPACTSGASISCLPCKTPSQQIPANLPATSISLPSVPLPLPSKFSLQQNPPPPSPSLLSPQPVVERLPSRSDRSSQLQSGVLQGLHNSSVSAVELLIDVENRAGSHLPNILQHLAGTGLNTNALDQLITGTLGNADGNLRTSAIASDVVCLSDGEN